MNNEENNLNNENIQNTSNPEILESTPVGETQPTVDSQPTVSSSVSEPNVLADNSEILSPEEPASDPGVNEKGARIETEAGGEVHIHLEAYQPHEKKEKKQIVRTEAEEKGYSRRRIGTIIFFIALIAFVMFLPNIRQLITAYQTHVEEEEIKSGKLICTLERSDNDFDYSYTETFSFNEYKLKGFIYKVETTGDASKDVEKFREIYNKCDTLSRTVGISNLSGIVVDCNYVEGDDKVVETQTFDYNTVVKTEVKSAYTEAGIEYPEFELNDNINDIEKSVLAGGFSCQKVS